jgi:hypothetical protein
MDVWADEIALYIWSGNERADLTPIKAAKATLDIDKKVKPIGVNALADLPSLHAHVLAIGSRPPFLCDYALTSERTSPAGWQRALRWVLDPDHYEEKATTMLDTLTSLYGPATREIPPEQLEAERKMRVYQLGLE